MPRERIATREAVFQAANTLAQLGEKVTVAAVREEVGGGSNTSIHELLVEWRRQRRSLTVPARQHAGANGALVTLPEQLEHVMSRFSLQLGQVWTESLARFSEGDQLDQLAVIRAAAEARVREAEAATEDLRAEIDRLDEALTEMRGERDTLVAGLEIANERMALALAEEEQVKQDLAELQNRATRKIEGLMAERDALRARLVGDVAGIPAAVEEERRGAEGAAPADDRDPSKTNAEREALEAEISALRAELEEERAKYEAKLAESDEARRAAEAEAEQREAKYQEVHAKAIKQAAWIRDARELLSRHGMLKQKQAK